MPPGAPPVGLVPELIVSELGASLRFYCELLRFEVRYARPEERFACLQRQRAELMLEQPLSRDRLWPREELKQPYGRGLNLEVRVDDIDELHAAVVGAGLELFLPLEERWYARAVDEVGVRQFAVQDPDGYLIRLSQTFAIRPLRVV